MPRVTIWIRNEDHAKWLAIADKPSWLHERLNVPTYHIATPADDPGGHRDAGGSRVFGRPLIPDEPTIEPFEPAP